MSTQTICFHGEIKISDIFVTVEKCKMYELIIEQP